jgi:hypothetical protein
VARRVISPRCTLRLRHETSRWPDETRKSLSHISFVDSSREVQRPEHGKARETVLCDHCGRSAEFTVFSVKRTQRMRTLWSTLSMSLLALIVAGFVFMFNLFASPGWGYFDALPTWAEATVITSGILSMWVTGFVLFLWADEFGIRSVHRWRHTGQVAVPDKQRGNFIGTCAGTWDRQDPPAE